MGQGKRYEGESKINIKKVFGLIVAILVIIMCIISFQKILTPNNIGSTDKDAVLGYFPVYTGDKWGVIDTNGDFVINPIYSEMIIVPDNKRDIFICTYDMNLEKDTYKVKVVNKNNQDIFTNYDKIELLDNYDKNNNIWYEKNILKVQKEGLYGIINYDGKELLKCEYEEIETLKTVSNSLIIKKDGKLGICNGLGEIIAKPEYTKIYPLGDSGKQGYIVANEDNKYGIINKNNKLIIEPQYEEIKQVSNDNLYIVKDNTLKIIDKDNQVVLDKGFEEVVSINNKNLIVKNNGKYSILDLSGNVLLKSDYEYLEYIYDNYYIAKMNNKFGVIDLTETNKIDFKYLSISYRSGANFIEAENENYETEIYDSEFNYKLSGIITDVSTDNGYMRVRVGEDYKYYNFKFEEKQNYEVLVGKTLYLSKKDGKYGYIDKNKNLVVDYIYDDAKEQNEYGYSAVKVNNLWGVIDKMGKLIVEPKYELKDNLIIDFIDKYYLGRDINLNYYTDKQV